MRPVHLTRTQGRGNSIPGQIRARPNFAPGAPSSVLPYWDMAKPIYRIVPQKRVPACDVEMTEAGAKPRIINTVNTEAEAWDWLNEKVRIDKLAARRIKAQKNKH